MKHGRFYLLTGLLAVSILTMGVLEVSVDIVNGDAILEKTLQWHMENTIGDAVTLDKWLETHDAYLSAVAAALSSIDLRANRRDLRDLFKYCVAGANKYHYTDFYMGFPNGDIEYADDWEPGPNEDFNPTTRPWYLEAAREPGKTFITNPYQSVVTKNLCLTFSRMVEERGGGLAGVVGADIDIDVFNHLVTAIENVPGSRAFLTDAKGAVIFHTQEKYRPNPGDAWIPTLDNVAGGSYKPLKTMREDQPLLLRNLEGELRYYFYAAIPTTGWRLYSSLPANGITDPINNRMTVTITSFLAMLAVTSLLIYITGKTFMHATRTAQMASRSKTRFLANMSHEIRTPLNGIMGFVELLLAEKNLTDKRKDYLDRIKISAVGLLDIINNILDISKIEAGKVELEKVPFSMHDVIKQCEIITSVRASQKGLNIFLYAEPQLPKKLLGDPTKLRQALLNLLSNSVKFTESGTVKLLVAIESQTPESVTLRFEVKDSGIGMTPEQIEKIFAPFTQADESTTRKYGGTGLGLAITKSLVDLMGGRLNIESVPSIGSRFSFIVKFPLSPESEAEPGERDSTQLFEGARPSFQGEVLVCEDSQLNQEVIREHLRMVGLEPLVVGNGAQGVKAVSDRLRKGVPFDLILMDINMPVMDGFEATQKLLELGSKTPIVPMTANVMSEDITIYKKSGMTDFLGKPFVASELWDCLRKFLPLRETPPGGAVPEKPVKSALDANSRVEVTPGDERFFQTVLEQFHKYNHGRLDEIRSALANGNIKEAHRLTHTIKGDAGLIGAGRLREAAQAVEAILKTGKADFTEEQMRELESAMREALDKLPPKN